jgi:8-oxo-dGTP diphosphatase
VLDGVRVLLIRRGSEPMKGEWSLPGGKLELGETLRDGVVREVREETGLTVAPGLIVEVVDRIVRDDEDRVRYHYVLIDFLCSPVDGELRAGSDAESAAWVPRSQLAIRNIAQFTLAVIEKAFALQGL